MPMQKYNLIDIETLSGRWPAASLHSASLYSASISPASEADQTDGSEKDADYEKAPGRDPEGVVERVREPGRDVMARVARLADRLAVSELISADLLDSWRVLGHDDEPGG
jgi:hypothetical protein